MTRSVLEPLSGHCFRILGLLLVCCCLTIADLRAQEREPSTLRAGAAMTNVTPPLGELIVGGFSPLPAADVHDELHVRAIVLDDGRTKVAIAVCDNVGIAREVFDEAKRQVQDVLRIPPSHQLYAATHTHSATSARSADAMRIPDELSWYQSFLAKRIADAVRMADKRLRPAKLAYGSADEPGPLHNRRWFVQEEVERRNPFGGIDQVRMNPGGGATLLRTAGPIDPQISFLSLIDAEDKPIALLANYSLHYVGGVPARTISADYFAVFAEEIGRLLQADKSSPQFVGILSNGTSGDVNNIDFRNRGPSRPDYEKMREVGTLIAERVHSAMKNVEYKNNITLDARAGDLELEVRKPTADLLKWAEETLAKPETAEKFHAQERVYAQRVQLQATSPDKVNVPLQVVRIGSIGIAAVPFEVFTETGLLWKEASALRPSFTMELAGGSYGYLPTPDQHELGGYETWLGTNKVEKNASQKILERLLKYAEELQIPHGK